MSLNFVSNCVLPCESLLNEPSKMAKEFSQGASAKRAAPGPFKEKDEPRRGDSDFWLHDTHNKMSESSRP